MSGFSTEWVNHFNSEGENKDKFVQAIKASKTMQERLLQILEDKLREIDNRECTEEDFKDPNWSEKQAFRNGRKTELKRLIQLLTF